MIGVPIVHCPKIYWHFSKLAEYKINIEKSIIFLYSSDEKIENEIKTSIYISTKKNT